MKQEYYKFFQNHGCVSLGKILTNQELEFYTEIFERDWSAAKDFWREFGHHQTINCDVLVSSPEVDGISRPYEAAELRRDWHRDRSHWMQQPLRIAFIQAMLYLTDVEETVFPSHRSR